MDTLIDRSTAQRRFVMSLLTGFAMAALLLAAVGVFGAVSQSVAQRTQEIGLRMALGSSPGEAVAMVFRDGMRLALTGRCDRHRRCRWTNAALAQLTVRSAAAGPGFFRRRGCYVAGIRRARMLSAGATGDEGRSADRASTGIIRAYTRSIRLKNPRTISVCSPHPAETNRARNSLGFPCMTRPARAPVAPAPSLAIDNWDKANPN